MARRTMLNSDDLNYSLPDELIAQAPSLERGGSQLMVVEAGDPGIIEIGRFSDTLLSYLRPDDLVVANDSRVLNARLRGRRATGGAVELLLLEPLEDDDVSRGLSDAATHARSFGEGAQHSQWYALAKPRRRLHIDDVITLASGAEVIITALTAGANIVVELPVAVDAVEPWLLAHGELPLPPYITTAGNDPARYQTVHAEHPGSVAAPTAGLHFDDTMWQRVSAMCETARVTLHVGAGTFRPVDAGVELSTHLMHSERYTVTGDTDRRIRSAMDDGRRVVAVGTTTVRVLESVYGQRQSPLDGATDIFITPGYEFGCVGALLTNFHLPRSTLLALIMAFGGIEPARAWYRAAVAERMRFFSFGDAMFIDRSHAHLT